MLEPTNTVKTLIRNSSTPGKPGLGREIHPMDNQPRQNPTQNRKYEKSVDKTKQNENQSKVSKVAAKCRRQMETYPQLREILGNI